MENTSAGYHTFSFYQKLKADEYSELITDFRMYEIENKDVGSFPIKDKNGKIIGWEYFHKKDKGIRWLLLSSTAPNGFFWQGIAAIINPRALIEKNYIAAAQEDDLEVVERIFNSEAAKISPIIWRFGSCSLNRADFCLNIDLKELGIPCSPKEMITLIKRGNIPKRYKERTKYHEKYHRWISDKNTFYLESKSMNINYYWKFPQQENDAHPNFAFRKLSYNVIRFEVQYKYPKLYQLVKDIKENSKFSASSLSPEELDELFSSGIGYNPSIPIDVTLSSKVSDSVNRKHLAQIIGRGDYFTLDGARSIVESYNYKRNKEERLVKALELINECHGVAKAKAKLNGRDLTDFNRSLKDLDKILVNPVTIPRRWNIVYIPNPMRAYDNSIYVEELVPVQEHIARQHIIEFLSERARYEDYS